MKSVSRWFMMLPVVALVVSGMACGIDFAGLKQKAQEEMGVAESQPVPVSDATAAPEAPPEAAPVISADLYSVNFEGVELLCRKKLSTNIRGEIVPASDNGMDAPAFANTPEYPQFVFENYPITQTFTQPLLRVFSTDAYIQINSEAGKEINLLNQVLNERPTSAEQLPYLPFVPAAQILRMKIDYLDFQNGSGVRYLTQYGQAIGLITNYSMFYTFQGITNDGTTYISASFPVGHPLLKPAEDNLSEDEYRQLGDNYMSYLVEVENLINPQPAASFAPDMALLDDCMRSINIQK